MDLLFSVFMNFSVVGFFLGWSRPGWHPWVVAGGLFTALAVLTKGPLALAFIALAGVAGVACLAW
jgi:4-amino-4-deoxy-L-arabinose transferase-like glycosyltransferase